MFANYYTITVYKTPFSRFCNEDTRVCTYRVYSYEEMEYEYKKFKRIIQNSNVLGSVKIIGYWPENQEQIYFWKKS